MGQGQKDYWKSESIQMNMGGGDYWRKKRREEILESRLDNTFKL